VVYSTTKKLRVNIRNWNTTQHKFWVTPTCPLHWCLMRRGTPLTRSRFMPALNTQRLATVLTNPSTYFSHAEYHYCVTLYRSDVQSELQSVCNTHWIHSFPILTHPSTCFSNAEYNYCVTILEHIELPTKLLDSFLRSNESNINQSIWCAIWATNCWRF